MPGQNLQRDQLARRAVQFFLICGAVGGLAVVGGYAVILLNYSLGLADKLKAAFGVMPTPGTVDVINLVIVIAMLGIPLALLLLLYLKYAKIWKKRVLEVWGERGPARIHSRPTAVPSSGDSAAGRHRDEYLRALAGTELWSAEIADLENTQGEPTENAPAAPELLAEKVFSSLEHDISRRAILTGLTVGISPSRLFDHITIVLASLEIQMHVLASLGRRPSLRTWYQCLVRAGTSLFANSYMNREDAFMLQYTTKGIATGLSAAGEMVDDLEFDEAFDAVESVLSRFATGDVSGAIVNTTLTGIEFGVEGMMSIGGTGLQLMGQLVEKTGDEMFQGVVSGGMLYYHGMSLAADSLAVDAGHRSSDSMTRGPVDCMAAVAGEAGSMALDYVRKRRRLLRDKKRAALEKIPVAKATIDSVNACTGGMVKAVKGTKDAVVKTAKGTKNVTVAAVKGTASVTGKATHGAVHMAGALGKGTADATGAAGRATTNGAKATAQAIGNAGGKAIDAAGNGVKAVSNGIGKMIRRKGKQK